MKNWKLILLLIVGLFSMEGMQAQSISNILSKYTDTNGKMFVQPLADVFGANMNTGLFSGAYIPSKKFTMSLNVVTMLAIVPQSKKTFMATPIDDAFGTSPVETATIFGSPNGAVLIGPAGTKYYFPGGFELSQVPFATPQLTIGSLYGTDLSVRFAAYNIGGDYGKFSFIGYGLRHSISQYFEGLPVDLAVGYYYQRFKVGTLFDATSSFISAQVSKDLSVFTFYGGLGMETSTFDVMYEFSPGDSFNVNTKGKNSVRATLGVKANLGPVRLNVDYNMADQSVLSVGLGFAIGDRAPKVKSEGK
ncbi:MAG: hypothetical protein RIS47_1478 [Bacteroidota bacterium]|jgi:hypothetical protein